MGLIAPGSVGVVSVPIFLGYMLLLWDPNHQTVYDRLAGTYVVENHEQQRGRIVCLFRRLEVLLLVIVLTLASCFFMFLFAWSAFA